MLHTDSARDALLLVLRTLEDAGYDFVTPTPATHARVLARADRRQARSLRDVFGWSLPFARGVVDDEIVAALERAGALEHRGAVLASRVRASRVRGALFLHSAYPTDGKDAVFLGPDTYRFADFIAARAGPLPAEARVVDIGAGAGVGGATVGRLYADPRLTLTDINREALWLAGINTAFLGIAAEIVESDGLAGVEGRYDLIVANPPFIIDAEGRAYRDGGDMHGARISLDWALAGARRLAPGGRLLLYTGSAIVAGQDGLRDALEKGVAPLGCELEYSELDPDIFGEELDSPAYRDVERIAAVGAVVTRAA